MLFFLTMITLIYGFFFYHVLVCILFIFCVRMGEFMPLHARCSKAITTVSMAGWLPSLKKNADSSALQWEQDSTPAIKRRGQSLYDYSRLFYPIILCYSRLCKVHCTFHLVKIILVGSG